MTDETQDGKPLAYYPLADKEIAAKLIDKTRESSFINTKYPFLDGYVCVNTKTNSIVAAKKLTGVSKYNVEKGIREHLYRHMASAFISFYNEEIDKNIAAYPMSKKISDIHEIHGDTLRSLQEFVRDAFATGKLVVVEVKELGLAKLNPDVLKVPVENPINADLNKKIIELKEEVASLKLQLEASKSSVHEDAV